MKHRAIGSLGSFTIHAPEDYRPQHRAHECTAICHPGNCETAHREHFGWDVIEAAREQDAAWATYAELVTA